MTSGYFDEVEHRGLLTDYPLGEAFAAHLERLGQEGLRRLQEDRFRQLVSRGWEVPFYARRWREHGLEPGDVQRLEDLTRLPSFSKRELMASVEAHPPFGDFHGLPAVRDAAAPTAFFHTTSGTTGTPQPLFFGARDREVQNALLARAYRLQGLRDDDVVHSVYGFGMVNGGHYVREAVLHFTKALYLPAGTGLETPSEQQVALMHRYRATVLVGFADYLKRLAEVVGQQGLRAGPDPAADIPVRMISGHIGQEDPSHLSELWGGAAVYDWYGVADTGTIAAQGPEREGLYIWEDAHLVETLDPESGEPLAEGCPGTLCVTSLFKNGVYPVIRFDTQDMSTIVPVDPAAALPLRRMSGFEGRADQMVKLRGINVYPTAIGALLDGYPELTGEYLCTVARHGHRDEMTVLVEARPGSPADLASRLAGDLRGRLGVLIGVALREPGALAALTGVERRQKPIRLLDER